ncbi:OmpA family protein [Pedobacter heparinus]|uniref:OmpA/MotB domain protein n=1 Tax=Pedobacter heparinus (strain ATCC 13125 / DSM 2366 / CIP 104194 / JCM 7457 / NBRC 12017 / NCIMB 9290 / NRRL B-14731 / HIM 762-3) TaxID=485917 RepID=C6XZB3_PEDHD|nr:OmpA family protein [Pedobacter heparinus]ACU04609.1 OmpA/MotB domain protein [Pedobacter heparinus DSM 2366]
MRTRTIVFLALLLPAAYSCKTKKILAKSPETAETKSTDNEIFNIQRELPGDQVERTAAGIRFTFSSEILFPTNSSYLNEKSKSRIDDVAKVIRNKYADRKVLVEGHSDKTGTPEYNLWLSEKRAASVKTYLVSLGIPEANIKTSGLGDTRPVADNKTKEGRLINRRVEVTVLKAD